MREMPYFMTNKDWYTRDWDDDERGYKLTESAPQDAIDSYNEFYGLDVQLEGGAAEDFADYRFELPNA